MDNKTVTIGGVVTAVRSINTKNGTRMAFVKIEDKSGECELIVFPGVYEKLNSVWEQDQVVLAKGKVNYKDRDGNLGQELKVLVDQANRVSEDDAKAYQATGKKPKPPKGSTSSKKKVDPPVAAVVLPQKKTVYVHIKDADDETRLKALRQVSTEFGGSDDVVLVIGEGDKKTALRLPFKVKAGQAYEKALLDHFDKESLHIK